MRRKTIYIVVVVVVLVLILALVLRITDSMYYNNQQKESTAPKYNGLEATITRDSLCEVLLDFGRVHGATTAVKNIRLHNTTESPIVLLGYEATCRCVSVNIPNKAVEAGGYTDIGVEFDSRGEFGSIGNYVSIYTSDNRCSIAVWISAEVE